MIKEGDSKLKTIAVTGGSGGAGSFVIKELLASGYECVNLDRLAPDKDQCEFRQIDMNDYTAVFDGLNGVDAIVHFAGNPQPDFDHIVSSDRFTNNTNAVFNCFNAAQANGIKRVVWASSETIFGFPFEISSPDEIPLTENARRQPQGGYALSKAVCEDLAAMMAQLYGMAIIGLRISNVLYDDPNAEASYQKIPSYWENPNTRKFNLWGYIDARDCARACRLALESDIKGAEVFAIAAKDTIMSRDTRDLMAIAFPNTKINSSMQGRASTISSDKARRVLGWEPKYTWADVLDINLTNNRD